MQVAIANTLKEGLIQLGIAESSYFRWKKQGRASDEMIIVDGKPMVQIAVQESGTRRMTPEGKDPQIESFFGHKKYLKGWIEWRDSGIGQKVWSKVYRKHQVRYGTRFFEKYDELTSANLRDWISELPPESYSGRSDRYCFGISMAKYLYKELPAIISEDEYARIKAMHPGKSPDYEPEQHIIYDEDVETIFSKVAEYYAEKQYHALLVKTLLTILAETGLRVSELASLQRENLHFSDSPAKAFIRVRGKGSKIRKVPFSRAAQAAIREYLAGKPAEAGEDCLFKVYHYRKKEYTPFKDDWLKHELKYISDFAGIRFTAHSFRHYRITKWANNPRIPITSTQLWAGHSQLNVTQNYIHIRDDDALIAAFG